MIDEANNDGNDKNKLSEGKGKEGESSAIDVTVFTGSTGREIVGKEEIGGKGETAVNDRNDNKNSNENKDSNSNSNSSNNSNGNNGNIVNVIEHLKEEITMSAKQRQEIEDFKLLQYQHNLEKLEISRNSDNSKNNNVNNNGNDDDNNNVDNGNSLPQQLPDENKKEKEDKEEIKIIKLSPLEVMRVALDTIVVHNWSLFA